MELYQTVSKTNGEILVDKSKFYNLVFIVPLRVLNVAYSRNFVRAFEFKQAVGPPDRTETDVASDVDKPW